MLAESTLALFSHLVAHLNTCIRIHLADEYKQTFRHTNEHQICCTNERFGVLIFHSLKNSNRRRC